MSSPDGARPRRRAFVAGASMLMLGGLAGCGFTPLYGAGEDGVAISDTLTDIKIAVIPDRDGQILRNYLIERFNPSGRPTEPRFVLEVGLREAIQRLGIEKDATATRANLIVSAPYRVTDSADGSVVVAGEANTVTSYSILDDQFATLSAERSARDRALRQLSDTIRTRVSLHFAQARAETPGTT
ncbi:MAG: LPS assembly lipoprotein LptE [Inquilinaceae bacterium]